MTPSQKILFIGEPLNEYVATVEADESRTRFPERRFAGDVAPNMATYARLAAMELCIPGQFTVLTAIGPAGDADSDMLLAELEARGLNLHPQSERIAGKTLGSVTNLRNPDGSAHPKKVDMDRASSAFRELLRTTSDADLAALSADYTHIVTSTIPLACIRERAKLLKVLTLARRNNPQIQIVANTNLRPANWRMADHKDPQGLPETNDRWKAKARHWADQLVNLADIVQANFTDEAMLRDVKTSDEARRTLRQLNPKAEIIITNDANPILLSYMNGRTEEVREISAHPEIKPVDTVGAGDSFGGTYMIARQILPVQEAGELGALIGSQVIGFKGALPPVGATLNYGPRRNDPTTQRAPAGLES